MDNVKKVQEGFDFKTVDAPKSMNYLQPGFYKLGIASAEYVKPAGEKPEGGAKTPYVEVVFECDMGKLTEKFFVTPKALDRLQYLHLAWFEKKLDKLFTDADSVGAYFAKVLPMKPIVKGVEVGGKQGKDGKIYAGLGYSNFVLPDEMSFEAGPFAIGDMNYQRVVRMLPPNASTGTNDIMLPASSPANQRQVEDSFDLPF